MSTPIATATDEPAQIAFVVETVGPHRFAYAKIAEANGQTVGRWPLERPLSHRVQIMGTVVDITA